MPAKQPQGSELGHHLKLLRIKNNLTMMQTAAVTGITQGYISQIENGIYTPSAKTLAKLARAYKVAEIQLLRKAGIVQLSNTAPATGDLDSKFKSNLFDTDPLIEVSDTGELMDLLKRGLASLEYLSDQIRQRGQVSSLPSAQQEQPSPTVGTEAEIMLPIYDSSWQPKINATGDPAALGVPSFLCADDSEAFILTTEDNSMAPLINTGDWVIISPAADLNPGNIAAINDRNQIQLRSYSKVEEKIVLNPLNHDYAHRLIMIEPGREKVEIIGRALRVVNREL